MTLRNGLKEGSSRPNFLHVAEISNGRLKEGDERRKHLTVCENI